MAGVKKIVMKFFQDEAPEASGNQENRQQRSTAYSSRTQMPGTPHGRTPPIPQPPHRSSSSGRIPAPDFPGRQDAQQLPLQNRSPQPPQANQLQQLTKELKIAKTNKAKMEEELTQLVTLQTVPDKAEAPVAGAYTAGLTPAEVAIHLGSMYDHMSNWVGSYRPLKDAYKTLTPHTALACMDGTVADVAAALRIEGDRNLFKYVVIHLAMDWLRDNLFSDTASTTGSASRGNPRAILVRNIWLRESMDAFPKCEPSCRQEISKKVSELQQLVFELSYEAQARSPDESQPVYEHLAWLLYDDLMGKFGKTDRSNADAVQQLSIVIRHAVMAVTLVNAIGRGGEFTRTKSFGGIKATQHLADPSVLRELLFRVGEDQQVERALGSPTWKRSERVLLSVCPGYVLKVGGEQQQGVCHVKEKVVTVTAAAPAGY